MNPIKTLIFIRWLLIVYCYSLPGILQAQVTVSVQMPPGGMVQKEQLWNLIIVNNKDLVDAFIRLSLQDVQTGQVILSANSGSILLDKGVKVVTSAAVQPVLYNYNTAGLTSSFLPMGSYIACYQLYYLLGDAEQPLSNECMRFDISPLSPPLLTTPADKSVVQTTYPLFTWMPPTPVNMFSDLSYDILIAEKLAGQSPAEAIEHNTPLYSKSHLTQPLENYSSAFAKLDTGKTYAWQVVAKNNYSYAAKTEAWTFTIESMKSNLPVTNSSYILLNSVVDNEGIYHLKEKDLNIKYYCIDKANTAVIRLLSADGKTMQEISQPVLYGDNFFNIKLKQGFNKGQLYTIELITIDGSKHSALFSINK